MKLLGIIFSNIYDNSMGDLTRHRTVSSLPFGGRYRQIDFVLSNMVNSNISYVGIITKSNYQSLMDHLMNSSEWDLDRKNSGLYILPPFGSGGSTLYRGKLEALDTARRFIEKGKEEYVILCDSSVICNIDFEEVLDAHIRSEKDITSVVFREENPTVKRDLVLEMKGDQVRDLAVSLIPKKGDYTSMGMFVMKRTYLMEIINYAASHGLRHLEKDFIQRQFAKNNLTLNPYIFRRTVLINQDIDSYLENSLRLLDPCVREEIFLEDAPIYTKVRDEAPAYYFEGSDVRDCLIADGCLIRGKVENSILFRDVTVEEGATVKNSIVMQGSRILKNSHVDYVILDKEVVIQENRNLVGAKVSPIIINKGKVI